MNEQMKNEMFTRLELLIGKEKLAKLAKSHVAIIGLGGVGGYVAEGLIRSGIGEFSIFDGDTICVSNLNRQIIATLNTIGLAKSQALKARMLSINPEACIHEHQVFIDSTNISSLDFSSFDYIIDACDTIATKLLLIEKAKEYNVPIISTMGCGNKLNPSGFMIKDINQTKVCPLAKVIRYELRKRGITGVKVCYSEEEPVAHGGQTIASDAFVPASAGLLIADAVFKELIKD